MTDREWNICAILGLYVRLGREDKKRFINIMKASFPKQADNWSARTTLQLVLALVCVFIR